MKIKIPSLEIRVESRCIEIKIPFLKVPLFIFYASFFMYYEMSSFSSVLMEFFLFMLAIYATARAIYVKKFFWAWLMGSMAVLVVPVFGDPLYITDRPFFTTTVYSLAWFFLSDFGIEFSPKVKKFYQTHSRSIKKIAICLLLGVVIIISGLIYFAKTVLFNKESTSAEKLDHSRASFDPKNLVPMSQEEFEAYVREKKTRSKPIDSNDSYLLLQEKSKKVAGKSEIRDKDENDVQEFLFRDQNSYRQYMKTNRTGKVETISVRDLDDIMRGNNKTGEDQV